MLQKYHHIIYGLNNLDYKKVHLSSVQNHLDNCRGSIKSLCSLTIHKLGYLLPLWSLLLLGVVSTDLLALDTRATTLDSIIRPKYQGYRLQLNNIILEKSKGNQRKIKCTLINTGREKISLPHKGGKNTTIIFQYDHTLAGNDLESHQNSLERALLKKKFILDVGKIDYNFELKFNISNNPSSTRQSDKEGLKKRQKIEQDKIVTNLYDKDYCPDLRIDTIFVDKRYKKKVELAFTITNYGKGPAALFGETKALEDNVAVRVYASGTPKLSRGDLVLGGAFIEDGLEDKNGVLLPNEHFSGSIQVETRKKTRYMPYFILSIDDYQSLWECDERNNTKPLLDK